MFINYALNLQNISPWSGLVKWSDSIFVVDQCSIYSETVATRPLMKKYCTCMCFVFFVLNLFWCMIFCQLHSSVPRWNIWSTTSVVAHHLHWLSRPQWMSLCLLFTFITCWVLTPVPRTLSPQCVRAYHHAPHRRHPTTALWHPVYPHSISGAAGWYILHIAKVDVDSSSHPHKLLSTVLWGILLPSRYLSCILSMWTIIVQHSDGNARAQVLSNNVCPSLLRTSKKCVASGILILPVISSRKLSMTSLR